MSDAGDFPARRSRAIVEQLTRAPAYREYERAFQDVTGLPLRLRAAGAAGLPHRGSPCENPFCALAASGHPAGAACPQHVRRVEAMAGQQVRTLECFAGLAESAVPVRHAGRLVGFLHTGQVRLRRPGRGAFTRALASLRPAGSAAQQARLQAAYARSRVLTASQYASVLRLVAVFARHLGALSARAVVPDARPRSPQMARAVAFIAEHQAEDLTLSTVARAVGMSAFYFCKMFKQATGLTYTDYLAHVRVEQVKLLLREHGHRVRDAAFVAGFQSLSQFNRVFRRVEGEPPSRFRARVQGPAAS